MSVSLWAYDPDYCDGDYCPNNCDICAKREARENEVLEPDADDLEMGFDPYQGCYTDDC